MLPKNLVDRDITEYLKGQLSYQMRKIHIFYKCNKDKPEEGRFKMQIDFQRYKYIFC